MELFIDKLKSASNLLVLFLFSGYMVSCATSKGEQESLTKSLQDYRNSLKAFRIEFGGTRDMPDVNFFLFGMGNRTKLVYRDGVFKNAVTGEELYRWKLKKEIILPPSYTVYLSLADGNSVRIEEDKEAVWIIDGKSKIALEGTKSGINLPEFAEYKYPMILKVLHHEILINIIDGKPVPNFLVYRHPWRRDGAMMAMCLSKTGNIDLIKEWLKFGLKSINLPDKYTIPEIEDDYSALFWWDYKDSYKPGTKDADDKDKYPYLGWACDNFHGKKGSPVSNRDYPLTWEIGASQADYTGMSVIDEKYVAEKNSSPHTWHASEVFLYVISL